MSVGVENLKLVLAELIEAGNVAGEIVEMKGVTWYKRLPVLLKIMDESMDLLKVDWKLLPEELKDLDDCEKDELKSFFMEKFDIPQDEAEAKVEKAFELLVGAQKYITDLISFAKSMKK